MSNQAARLAACVALLVFGAATDRALAINPNDTRMLAQPAVSERQIAFVYADDLWVANLDGSDAKRLTGRAGEVANPHYSPDGTLIAFSARRDSNADVYVVPASGGEPQRLTWHPLPDAVQGFTPDGKNVLFTSAREVHTNRFSQLFTVPITGGVPTRLPIPNAARATYSPDGAFLAYNPLGDAFRQWKNYRGGRTSRLWLYDSASHDVVEIPQPAGRCNDVDPMWLGGTIYFLSDRSGEFNLFAYDVASKRIEQLTKLDDFPIQAASAGGGRIIYEQGGYLHLFDLKTRESTRLVVSVAAELPELRDRWASGFRWVRNTALSPSGARAAIEFRGEIISVPADKGDPRNLTKTPAAHERSPAWSPDGASIAYLSDAGGEYLLKVEPQDGKGETKTFVLDGAGFFGDIGWSPDSRRIAYEDNSHSLYWLDLGTGKVKKISTETMYSPVPTLSYSWSPDSAWLAYTQNTESYLQRVHLYSLEQDRSWAITEGLADVGQPVFDPNGKQLYFFGSTDAGPVRDWFALSGADAELTGTLYLAVLAKGVVSPLAKESDEEKGKAEGTDKDTSGKAEPKPAPDTTEKAGKSTNDKAAASDKDKTAKTPAKTVIDIDGIAERIVPLSVKIGAYSGLQVGETGMLYYVRRGEGSNRFSAGEAGTLYRYDLGKREETQIVDKVGRFAVSTDGKKLLYATRDAMFIVDSKGKLEPGKGKLAIDAIKVRVEPRSEWPQIFAEAWRINRDFFYATNFHGADWPAMRSKYEAFLPDLACRADLNRLIMWMCSELAVGHHRIGGGDTGEEPKRVPIGLLGADIEAANGRYRFAKIYGGLNWNPELRSPLTEPGVDVKPGEYLLAVNGDDLKPPQSLYARFENTVGAIVEITVGSDPNGKGSRVVKVVPTDDELSLRNRDWVEGNIKKVDAATKGRVAYVYVPNTSTLGHTYFKRYFYPQAHKDAIIVDERFNGGGQVADYYIDILRRPFISMWNMRYGPDLKTPQASIQGPKVMIIDETAGSGGDMLPWMFRKQKLGPLVGKRTWGGLVGILGFPVLMDGANVTAPNLAIWTEDGWIVENEGVPPDVEVEQLPKDIIAGRDPQLEKAIEIVLAGLAKNPPHTPKRPPYPGRVRK